MQQAGNNNTKITHSAFELNVELSDKHNKRDLQTCYIFNLPFDYFLVRLKGTLGRKT